MADEFARLYEGNISRYRIKLSDYLAWRKANLEIAQVEVAAMHVATLHRAQTPSLPAEAKNQLTRVTPNKMCGRYVSPEEGDME